MDWRFERLARRSHSRRRGRPGVRGADLPARDRSVLVSGRRLSARDALFFIFHLLGEWREKSAYRPLARLLRRPPDDVDYIFGGAVPETTHRVMAAVFDGDPAPLYDVILDPKADASIRSRMCEAIAMVTLRGEMPRAEAVKIPARMLFRARAAGGMLGLARLAERHCLAWPCGARASRQAGLCARLH